MSATLDILFGVTGQSLVFDAPEGRPSSVTSSSVFAVGTSDEGTAESATTGSAAVETNPATTFNASSGLSQTDPRKCNLTAITGIAVGRTYRVANSLSEVEQVEVVAISSVGPYVLAREPLLNNYTTADTFVSTRISHAISSTWVADKNKLSDEFDPNPAYRWRLVYVVSSVTYIHDLYFDLLRYPARHDVSWIDVDRRAPGWLNRLPTYHREDQGRAVIDEAHRAVKFDLYNVSTPDQSIRNREVVNELVLLKSIELVDGSQANPTPIERYERRLTQLIAAGKVDVAADGSGASTQPRPRPLLRR